MKQFTTLPECTCQECSRVAGPTRWSLESCPLAIAWRNKRDCDRDLDAEMAREYAEETAP
jgi:hypothetical protein